MMDRDDSTAATPEPNEKPFVSGNLVRGPSLCRASSRGLGWSNIAVERHTAAPGERPEVPLDRLVIEVSDGALAHGERPDRWGKMSPYTKEPRSLYVFAGGVIPAVRAATNTDLIACAFDVDFVARVSEEMTGGIVTTPPVIIGGRDDATFHLLKLLEQELYSDVAAERLYVDHLAYALAVRLLSLGSDLAEAKAATGKLPPPRLRRVIERMEANLSESLDLETLAAESGYSRNHFLRTFRAATGLTPHRYLMNLRVQRAQTMMTTDGGKGLLEIALACGFSSHAQLSRVFRDVTGVSPSDYRRRA